jgi:hypothetical protein
MKHNDVMIYKLATIWGGTAIGFLENINVILQSTSLCIAIIVGLYTLYEKLLK